MDSATIKNLIASSELQDATRQLAKGLADSADLQRVAVQLQERLHRLEQKEAKGIISEEDANLERNRITDILLRLTEQLDLPAHERRWSEEEDGDVTSGKKRMPWLIVGGLLLVALAAWGYVELQDSARPFDLTIYLDGLEAEASGKVRARIGSLQLSPKSISPEGEVVFQEIPGQYRSDTIRIELINMPYRIVSQNHDIAAEGDKITMEVEPRPTLWRGRVQNPDGRPVPDAVVEVEQGLAETSTGADGRYELEVPRPSGSRIQVRVLVNGLPRYNRSNTISDTEPAVLQLNEPQ